MNTAGAAQFAWLRTGEEAFSAMLAGIAQARGQVRLETYIYAAGALGERFRAALVAASRRGVKVRVLIDAWGSFHLSQAFWAPLLEAGGQVAWFNPISLDRWAYRNHRKLLVCDDTQAFIGGFNIADEYNGDGIARGWRDLGLRVTGGLAPVLADSFDDLFGRANFRHKLLQQLRRAPDRIAQGPNWKLLLSGPGLRHATLKRTITRDLQTAASVKIVSAYFLPTWRLRMELLRVSTRGGRVQLILAGQSDVKLTQLATRRLYAQFLRAGVEVYEYMPQILHAKLIVLDDLVYVGSANLDTRSLRINYELVARIAQPELAAQAREIFAAALAHCQRIDRAAWRKSRSFWSKLKEDWAYFVLARLDPYLARRQWRMMQE